VVGFLLGFPGITPAGLLVLCLGLVVVLVLAALAMRSTYGRFRLFVRSVGWFLFRLRLHRGSNLPATGGVLLVCNPVTYLDWIYLVALLPRQVTLLIPTPGYARSQRALSYLRWAGVLAIDETTDEASIEAAFATARQRLAEGGVVCILAQGWRSKAGADYPASRVLTALARPDIPIIPLWFEQAWGSLWHLHDDHYRWKWPSFLGESVQLTVGDPLPGTTRPGEVLAALHLLGAQCAIERNAQRPPPHRQFVRMAARQPFHLCLVDGMGMTPNLTFGKALTAAMCFTEVLKPILGDTKMVGLWLPPGPAAALANIALAFLGKVSVNLNYTSSAASIASSVRQCQIRHVLTSRKFVERIKLELPEGVEPIYLEDIRPKVTTWMRLRNYLAVLLLPGAFLEHFILGLGRHTNDDLATVIFSSGSTGDPKGVMLTHGNIAANIESAVHGIHLDSKDTLLGVLPFFHSFGYTITLWAPLNVGAAAVYYPDPRAAREIGELCKKYRCTIYVSTATFLRFCLRKCEVDDFHSLSVLICGAEKLPIPLQQEFWKKFGVPAMEGYGCTELSPASATNMPDRMISGFVLIGNRPGTIGPPLPGNAARIVHPDTLEILTIGEEGLLLMIGANVMKGYLGRDDLTKKVKIEGWYLTGDMGKLDEEGHITLTGRLSRFAKVGGEMVPLERIEEELHDLLEAGGDRLVAVTCVPDEVRGERLVVLYLEGANLDIPGIVKQMSQRGLPSLWLPAERDYYPVPEMPVLGTGKLDLRGLKELALKLARR
jgi:acyl-[acyl-carrier-protein]-phospholipid O-acyltransferase/long-chain-fatty-acid--[acyl-carrier-protein] ligase